MNSSVAVERLEHLAHGFDLGDVRTLCQDMRAANCIISGSAPLSVLRPYAFTPNDLDFYLPTRNRALFEEALTRRGYTVHGRSGDAFYPGRTIDCVTQWHKAGISRSINLILTSNSNPLSAVVDFHSTLVMNVITADGILSLYPALTLLGRGVINVMTTKARRCFDKYLVRGFRFTSFFERHSCGSSSYCRTTWRSIVDSDVLAIPFEEGREKDIAKPFTPFEWKLGPIRYTDST